MKTLLLGAAILAFAACGSDDNDPADPMDPTDPTPDDPNDPTPPDQSELDYNDVAMLVGASAQMGELSAMLDVVILSHGGTPPGITVTPVMMGDHFAFATGTRGGVTFEYLYHCNDNADAILTFCDPSVNHSHVQVNISGNVTGAGMSVSNIERDGDWAVRNINVGQPRVGGDATMTFTAQVTGTNAAMYNVTYNANFDRVRYAPTGGLPISGKIDFTASVNRTRAGATRTFAVTGALAFDGDNTATLTLDASKNYSVDLATGITTKL